MTLARAGGVAALICAVTYLAGFALLVTLLAPLGFGGPDIDPAAVVAFIDARPYVLIAWNSVIYIVNALALTVLVVSLSEVCSARIAGLAAVSRALGLIWAALVLGAGMVANVAVERAASLFPIDPSAAAELWAILHAVELGLGGGNEIAGGAWFLCVSLAALRARILPSWLAGIGFLVGSSGAATLFPPLGESAGALFGLGAIAWFVGAGWVLASTRRHALPVADRSAKDGSSRGM